MLSASKTEFMQLTLSGGQNVAISGGIELQTAAQVQCEGDLHYFKAAPRSLKEGSSVIVDDVWNNMYGQFVRVIIDGRPFDIKPENLTWKRP